MSHEIRQLGVLGAGTMGHGIAQVAAQAGLQVRLYDLTRELAETGIQKIAATLQKGVEKGKVKAEERQAALARLSPVGSLEELAGVDAIIEAVPEKLPLKQDVFRKLSALCREDALFATNTSSLSLTEIAAAAKNPGRVVGMHFFNPVHLMKLVEVVHALQTTAETGARARELAEKFGKEVVVVQDHPGFASSRLGIALGMEAIRMVEAGVGSAADIDRAMELGYGHPMGPLKLTDLVGLDVRLAIAEYLHAELGSDTFRPPQLLKKMVRAGKLGKKSGEGFYSY